VSPEDYSGNTYRQFEDKTSSTREVNLDIERALTVGQLAKRSGVAV
jgi:hypothetical protein